jgi:8-oxo-dGTP pyrophosphatase MutT (NUDIX family)
MDIRIMDINKVVMDRKKKMIMCANCGGYGHVYKTCNHPTISYGFIVFKICSDKTPLYLMVQRKDSLSYVEFIRGKFELQNIKYLLTLISYMTQEEHMRLKTLDFDTLWNEMWCKDELPQSTLNNHQREYVDAQEKFARLHKGYYLKTKDSLILINLNDLIDSTHTIYDETEWGFPKGRRNVNENDLNCALREFNEETGFAVKTLNLCNNIKPLEEVFSGTNKKRYKHVYYVATFNEYENKNIQIPSCREIRQVKWFNYEDAQKNIRSYNIERKELLKRLNHNIVRKLT